MSDLVDKMAEGLDGLKEIRERSPTEFDAFVRKAMRDSPTEKARRFWKSFAEGFGIREGEEPPRPELLTVAEYTEHLIERIKEMPEAQRKVRLAEVCTVMGVTDPAEMQKLMQEPDPIWKMFRAEPPPEPICELCMKAGPSRLVRCERCKWRKVVCVECERRKDKVYGIGLDKKVLILHDATCRKDRPKELVCAVANVRCSGAAQEYVLTDRTFTVLCAGHVESRTDLAYHQGEPVTRSKYEAEFGGR
jgi:hypothetical protein